MQELIYIDLRCLQDENYRLRGIGLHIAALLRARERSAFATYKLIGLVDPQLPALSSDFRSLVDETTYSTNPCCNGERALFVDGSPMGHDSRFTTRFVNHRAFFRAAVIYDFIPFDWPGYLPTLATRIDYLARLARLNKFDFFFPISQYTARRANELLGISSRRMIVTGASVRRSIYDFRNRLAGAASPHDTQDPYFFVIYGGDLRKNVELAVQAVARLNVMYGRRIPLKVAGHYDLKTSGHYDVACRSNLLRLAGHAEGEGFLEFCPAVSDEQLVSLYGGAIATIVPSHIEGFSLPVAEASVCGCPVAASNCAAHLELIDQPEALFPSNDVAALCGKLDALLNNSALRDSLKHSQAHLGPRFHENAVGSIFWSGLEAAVGNSGNLPAIRRLKKPRLAFLSPYPPDPAGAAFYTANTIRAGESFFSADLYTNAPRPLTFAGNFRDAGRLSWAPIASGQYEGIVSVIGNSCCDPHVFGIFNRSGGPCILHDSPSFLESIVKRASPLMVHTAAEQSEIRHCYGADVQVLPCCPSKLFSSQELTTFARDAARERLGVAPAVFLISTFGRVTRDKGIHSCIAAVDLLRSWKIPAELHFVGDPGAETQEITRVASLYSIGNHVHFTPSYVDESKYRDFLIASDAAFQVRSSRLGRAPASLLDCIGAGLPSVTNSELALACDAPSYVRSAPDRFSPLQLAELLASIWESGANRDSHRDARAAYLEKHSFRHYAQQLVEFLGVA